MRAGRRSRPRGWSSGCGSRSRRSAASPSPSAPPARRDASAPPSSPAIRRSSACSSVRSSRSRSNVSSTEIEMRSLVVSSRRGSIPSARSRSIRPTAPGSSDRRSGSESAARPPIVVTPAAASLASARGPDARKRPHRERRQEGGLGPGGDNRDAAGLAPVRRDLRDDLRGRDAERARQARRRAHRDLHGFGDRAGPNEVGGDAREVEVALVETRPLDGRHYLAHGRPHLLRVLPVQRVARPDEDRLRAAAQSLRTAHRRVDPEAPRHVVRGRDDTAAVRVAADDERLASAAPAARAPRPRRRTRPGRDARGSA